MERIDKCVLIETILLPLRIEGSECRITKRVSLKACRLREKELSTDSLSYSKSFSSMSNKSSEVSGSRVKLMLVFLLIFCAAEI